MSSVRVLDIESQSDEGSASRFIAFIVAYDGTDFCGSQRQTNGRSVQGEIERALNEVLKTPNSILLAGRTDSGVHATGQVGRCMTEHKIAAERVPLALNRVLERDVRILKAWDVNAEFHPRYSATNRTYRYTIENSQIANPVLRRTAGHVRDSLDIDLMKEVCSSFIGEHDFAAWQNAGSPPSGGTVRNVTQLEVALRTDFGSELIEITISANGFLYQMVRNIVGALIEAGKGKLNADDIVRLTQNLDRTKCPPPAPPQGLCLTQVTY